MVIGTVVTGPSRDKRPLCKIFVNEHRVRRGEAAHAVPTGSDAAVTAGTETGGLRGLLDLLRGRERQRGHGQRQDQNGLLHELGTSNGDTTHARARPLRLVRLAFSCRGSSRGAR